MSLNPARLKTNSLLVNHYRRLAPSAPPPPADEPPVSTMPVPDPEPVPLPQALASKVKELPSGQGRARPKKDSRAVLERLMRGHGIRIME